MPREPGNCYACMITWLLVIMEQRSYRLQEDAVVYRVQLKDANLAIGVAGIEVKPAKVVIGNGRINKGNSDLIEGCVYVAPK